MRTTLLTTALLLIAATAARADVKSKTIPYMHNGQQFEGYLAWDDSTRGKRPGVLVVHEWWGLDKYARSRADQLAKLGYVAFAVDMYGKGKLTEHPQEAREMAGQVRANVKDWQQRAQKGLEILKSQDQVDGSKLAAIGYCFGGSTVLQLAYSGADVKAVVSFHGAPQQPTEDQAKQIKSQILICHGAADPFIPEDAVQKMRAALEAADANWTMVYYSNAKHSFTVPDADERKIDGMAYNKRADKESWQFMRSFLDDAFGGREN